MPDSASPTMSLSTSPAKPARKGSVRTLEPRMLFDAAAATTAMEVVEQTSTTDEASGSVIVTDTALFAPSAVRREAYVIDKAVQGYENLLGQVPAGAEIFLIDSNASGLQQLDQALASAGGQFDAVHIISHGADGVVQLGADLLTADNVQSFQAQLQALGGSLAADGDILLYGCDVAASESGQQFLQALSSLTGADVTASDDATGGVDGDALLEFQAGQIEADSWSAPGLLAGPLKVEQIIANPDKEEGDTSQADQLGYSVDASGDWVVAGGNGNGEVQVWRVAGNQRLNEQKLTGASSTTGFGRAVAIDGNTLVVADPDRGGTGSAGWLYIYRLNPDTNTWSLIRQLDTSNSGYNYGTDNTRDIGDWNSTYASTQWLALSGTHLVVGAANENGSDGCILWFEDTSESGDWSATFSVANGNAGKMDEPAADSFGAGNSARRFGASVAIANNILVVGAPESDMNEQSEDWGLGGSSNNPGGNHGAVFVYNWSPGGGPGALAKALAGNIDYGKNTGDNFYFGAAVDIEYFSFTPEDAASYRYTIVGGSPMENSDNGEVYIYQSTDNTIGTIGNNPTNIWGLQGSGFTTDSKAGLSISVSQASVIMGAPDHTGTAQGAVYFLRAKSNVWEPGLNTNNPDSTKYDSLVFTSNYSGAAGDDKFGRAAVLVSGSIVAVGAPQFGTDNRGAVVFYFARTPVAVSDEFTLNESSGNTTFNVKLGSGGHLSDGTGSYDGPDDVYGTETDDGVVLTAPTSVSKGILVWNADSNTFTYNPNGEFEYLATGESETVRLTYTLTGSDGFVSQAVVTIKIRGENDTPQLSAGLENITVPLTNEPQATPAGPSSAINKNFEIPISAFFDVDQSDVLSYSLVSVTPLNGAPAAPGGAVTVTGSYTASTGANSGNININTTGMTANTQYVVTIRATDNSGGTNTDNKFVNTTFILTVARENQNPEVAGTIPTQIATEDSVFSVNLLDPNGDSSTADAWYVDPDFATYGTGDPNAEALRFSIVSQSGPGADWLSVSLDGVLGGAPSNENVGSHTVIVRATDVFGNYIDRTINLTVNNTNDAPVLGYPVDRVVSIKGETFDFNVTTGAVTWEGGGAPDPSAHDAPYTPPSNYFFFDWDNSTADGRSPSAGDTIAYTAFNAVTGEQITGSSGGAVNSFNDTSWLRFNGTSFSGTSTGTLGSVITVRLVATDNHGASTETTFELGIFPRDGSATASGSMPTSVDGQLLGHDVAINAGNAVGGSGQGAAGRWAVVGMPGDSGGNGRIYVYENTNFATAGSSPSWTQRQTFVGATGSRLGTSVDISADGLRIVAGAPNENSQQGAVYYYTNSSGTWSAHTTAKGVSPDANNGDRFGTAVAINENGSSVLVGAPFDDQAATNAGAAYRFAFGAATGAGKIMPTADSVGVNGGAEASSARAGDLFGLSVAFDQNMVVVGAPRDDHGGKQDAGSVYVYSTDTNAPSTKLKKSAAEVASFDYFGTSVDVDSFASRNSVVVVVGTPGHDVYATDSAGVKYLKTQDAGAVYVYRSDVMNSESNVAGGSMPNLALAARVVAYDADPYDGFGASVAVDANEFTGTDNASDPLRMVVGSNLNSGGAVYAYKYYNGSSLPNGGWLGQRFAAADTGRLGGSVDLAVTTVIAGAPETTRTVPNAGAFYGFAYASGSPVETGFSGNFIKVVGDDQPVWVAPPVQSFQGAIAGNGIGNIDVDGSLSWERNEEEWQRLLRPVTQWSPGRPAVAVPTATQEYSAASPLVDELLYDQRTLKEKALLVAVRQVEVGPVEVPKPAEKAKALDESTPDEKENQSEPEQKSPETVPAEASNAMPGLSQQLSMAGNARFQEADRLLLSLRSLGG